MVEEQKIKQELEGNFSFLKEKVNVIRERRISVEVPLASFREVFDYAVNKLGFSSMSAITGLDEADNLVVIYHINKNGSIVLSIKVIISHQSPAVQTVTNYFSNADIFEREIMDLLGIKVENLAPGQRYPLTDDWPKDEFPLRKDWHLQRIEDKEAENE